ncbi:mechanosensitive ion channel [Alkalibacterium psychrotolerans]
MQTIRTYAEAYPIIANIIIFALVSVVLLILRRFLMNRMYNRLKNTSNWYVTRKVAKWINNLMLAILFLYIFGSNLTGFTTAIGLAGAGVTYALREVIVSFAGWFAILFGDFFNTGDRVLLGSTKGDVIDIGVLRTTLMEMEEWVDGDQYTGRIVRVANSSIFTAPVYNYTADFQFLWDEIHIPLRFNSDIDYARAMLLEVADEVIGTYHEQSEREWTEMKRRFRIENASLKPQVFVSFDDNWVKVSLRYVVGTRERRKIRDELFRMILKRIKASENKLQLASETIEIVPSED